MNVREIAKRAKVSAATISRTVNRVPTVDPNVAKRVWKVIDEVGYRPNIQARALVSGRSHILGLASSLSRTIKEHKVDHASRVVRYN